MDRSRSQGCPLKKQRGTVSMSWCPMMVRFSGVMRKGMLSDTAAVSDTGSGMFSGYKWIPHLR